METETHRCKCDRPGHCPWHTAITDKEAFAACVRGTPPPAADPPPCVHLGRRLEETVRRVDQPLYACPFYERCTLQSNRGRLAACSDCDKYVAASDPDLGTKFVDGLRITDRNQAPTTALRNMLSGGAAFLVCGGPSLKKLEYHRLAERGVFSLGVNNVAGFAPVSAFVCSDPPSKFHSGIWFDPNIMKFVPTAKFGGNRNKLRLKKPTGEFVWATKRINECPNVWGFERRSWLAADHTWFTAPGAAWGNQNQGVCKFGESNGKTANTMFLGLRILQYLGARKIFLLGVDFHMDPIAPLTANYAFGEQRDTNAIHSNNQQYAIANRWLIQLRPVFEQFGFEVYNCNRASRLQAFPYVPYETALEFCRGVVPKEPFDLENWYKK